MKIVDKGIFAQSVPGTDRAVMSFPSLVALSKGWR